MRSFARRRPFAFAAVALVVVTSAAAPRAARADDEPPPYRTYDIRLTEAAMPEGWKLSADAAGEADGKPVKDAILAIAKEKGLVTEAASKVEVLTQSAATADGLKAVFAFVDLAEKSEPFSTALKEAGTTKGWDVKELGAATRLVVLSSPADLRAKATALAVASAATQLSTRAKSTLEAAHDREGFEKAVALDKATLAIDSKCALAHYVAAIIALSRYQQAHGADDDSLNDGIAHLRAALAKDATGTLSAEEKTRALGELGGMLLQKGGPSVEARDLLKEAVAGVANVKRDVGLGYRYNLACAHGRLKELDDAFKNLTPVLEENAKSVIEEIQHWRADPDFDTLHDDPRWAEILKKYPDTTHTTGDGILRPR